MELKKDLTQLITEYLRDDKNNRDEILFYLATTENPSVEINTRKCNPLSLEGLLNIHDKLHDLVNDESVEFEGVSSTLGMSGALTIHITNNIYDETLLENVKIYIIRLLKRFKLYTIGFEEVYPQATLLLNLKYIFNIKPTSGDVFSINLDEVY